MDEMIAQKHSDTTNISQPADFRESSKLLGAQIITLLGWRIDDFWQATPAEIGTIIDAPAHYDAVPIDRHALDILIQNEQAK